MGIHPVLAHGSAAGGALGGLTHPLLGLDHLFMLMAAGTAVSGDFQERCRLSAPIQAACRKSNSSLAVVSSGGSLIQATEGCCQHRMDLDQRLGWRWRAYS